MGLNSKHGFLLRKTDNTDTCSGPLVCRPPAGKAARRCTSRARFARRNAGLGLQAAGRARIQLPLHLRRKAEAGGRALSLSAPCPGLALQALEVAASVIVREAPILNPETLHALHCLALPCTARSRSWPSRASRLGSPERRSPQHGMAWELWTSARRGVHPTELLAASRAVRLQTPITLFCSLQAFAVLSRLPNDDIGRVSIDFLRCRPKATCSPRVLTWSGSLQH